VNGVRVEHLVTSGTFSLDGGTWDVDNNVWLLGTDDEVIVVDAAHDADAIETAIGGRRVVAILCTHAHDDHVNAAMEVAARTEAPVLLHPDDRVLWDMTHAEQPDGELHDGEVLHLGDVSIQVLHTPGHAPGSCCFFVPELGVVLSGDTLFAGGPGATGRSYSDFDTIVQSIRSRLLTLPPDTRVLTGHGDETTIGAELPHLDEWVSRGH
jgi:glyoxylase-like metal-dependent hydrolase (beta-lactamase superfamily II)